VSGATQEPIGAPVPGDATRLSRSVATLSRRLRVLVGRSWRTAARRDRSYNPAWATPAGLTPRRFGHTPVRSPDGWEDSQPAERVLPPPRRAGATSPRFSRIGEGAPDASKAEALCQPFGPISERVDSRAVGACARPPPPPAKGTEMIGGLSKRGENPPWGLRRCLWARLRHRGAAPGEPEARTLPHPGPGISTWFPFAGGRDALQPPTPCGVGTERRASVPCQLQEACLSCPKPTPPSDRIRREPPRHRTTELPRPPAAQSRTLGTASPDRLGPTNPCPTAGRMEPVPTSALKVPA
jgi:hypothetical protein